MMLHRAIIEKSIAPYFGMFVIKARIATAQSYFQNFDNRIYHVMLNVWKVSTY